jgi:Na+/melibiose symporter-like transporter
MSNSDEEVLVTQRLRTMRIIMGALIAGCLAFLTISVILRQGRQNAAPPAMPIMTYTALWFAVFWTTISFIAPNFLVTAERRKMAKTSESHLNDPQARLAANDTIRLAGLCQMRMIIGAALVEGCVFFFIIVYWLEGSLICLLGALALLGVMAAKLPTRVGLERWLEQQRELLQQDRMGI